MPTSLASADASPPTSGAGLVSRDFYTLRVLLFLYHVAFGIVFPYLRLYYWEIGLSGIEIGVIGSFATLMAMLAGPFLGLLNDRFGRIRLLLAMTSLGGIIATLGLSVAHRFLWLLLFAAAMRALFVPTDGLIAGAALKLLGNRPERFGSFRVWGSIGFVISAWGFGQLFERTGLHRLFPAYITVTCMFLVAAFFLRTQQVALGGPSWTRVGHLVRQPTWVMFTLSLIILSIANSGMYNFLGIYLAELGGGAGLIGTATSLSGLAEIPIFLLGPALILRLGSKRLLAVAYSMYALRWLLYGIMPAPQWAMPLALMHMVTFGPYLLAGVDYANSLAPRGLQSTAQGLFHASFLLGSTIGLPISGWLFDTIGPAALFRIYAGLGVAALLVLLWGFKSDIARRRPDDSTLG